MYQHNRNCFDFCGGDETYGRVAFRLYAEPYKGFIGYSHRATSKIKGTRPFK